MSVRRKIILQTAGYSIAVLLAVRGLFLGGLPFAYAQPPEAQGVREELPPPLTARVFCAFSRWFNRDSYEEHCRTSTGSAPGKASSTGVVSPDPKTEDKKRGQTDQDVVEASIDLAAARDEEIRSEIFRLQQELAEIRAARSLTSGVGSSVPTGITTAFIENRIQALRNELAQGTYLAARSPRNWNGSAGGNFLPLTGGTLTGALVGTSATFSDLSVSGDVTLNTVSYTFPGTDGTTGQALTTDGAGTLSWSTLGGGGFGGGELVAEFITATSSTATSTFAGNISVATDRQYRIGGVPVLSRPSANNALIIGDHSGNARGSYSIDIQAYRFSGLPANVASGDFSFAAGYQARASGNYSTAAGYYVFATGLRSSAFGHAVGATGNFSFAAGYQSDAQGYGSVAMGNASNALGDYSGAIGVNAYTGPNGDYGAAIGKSVRVTNTNASALGALSEADGVQSLAVGIGTAQGAGFANRAIAYRSIAVGFKNTVSADGASAFGSNITNTVATSTMIGPSDSAKLTILSSGNLGVGTTSPWRKLSVDGTVAFDNLTAAGVTEDALCLTGAGEVVVNTGGADCTVSSSQFKDNISSLGDSLSSVLSLRPVSFTYINEKESGEHIGLIAEEVEQVEPRLVFLGDDGQVRGVRYNEMVALLVKGLQELSQQVDTLAAAAVTGTREVFDIVVRNLRAEKITTEELCVGDTCVTEKELQDLLNGALTPTRRENQDLVNDALGGEGNNKNSRETGIEEVHDETSTSPSVTDSTVDTSSIHGSDFSSTTPSL